MSYVAYHKETTRYLCNHKGVKTDKTCFASEGAARAAITREAKTGAINAADFLVADKSTFHNSIEKTVEVKNLMTGQPVIQAVNTPLVCDPSSETYWSM